MGSEACNERAHVDLRLLVLAMLTILFSERQTVRADSLRLVWDHDTSSGLTGFAVTIDEVRVDYGLSPVAGDGTCGCSVPLPLSSGNHTIVVSAYNESGETFSPPLIVGPTANAGGPYESEAFVPLTVSGAGSTDSIGRITNYSWSWGDGTSDTSSAAAQALHTYATAGTYTVTLTVTDDFQATSSAATTAAIAPQESPSVTLTASPDTLGPGELLTIHWTAPSDRSTTDWIGLFEVGAPNTEPIWGEHTYGLTSGDFILEAPEGWPAEYEFRYLLDDGFTDVARSNTVTVNTPDASDRPSNQP